MGSDKSKSKLVKKIAKGNVSGTTSLSNNDIVEDVKQVYLDEFEETRIEYNNKQNKKAEIKI